MGGLKLDRGRTSPPSETHAAAAYKRHGVTMAPVATTIVARSLYGGALIELDAVAVTPG